MNRLLSILSVLLLISACSRDIGPAPGESLLSVRAVVEDSVVDDTLSIPWKSGGRAAVSHASNPFSVRETSDGYLTIEGYAQPSESYAVIYPYDAFRGFMDPEDHSMSAMLTIPVVQAASAGSLPDGTGLAAGVSIGGGDVTLRHLNNYIRFTITPSSGRIRTVSAYSEGRQRLSGSFSADCSDSSPELMPMPDSYSNVALRAKSDYLSPGEYYMAINGPYPETVKFAIENDKGEVALYDAPYFVSKYSGVVFDIGEIPELDYKSWEHYPLSGTIITLTSVPSCYSLGFLAKKDYNVRVTNGDSWLSVVRSKSVEYHYFDISVEKNTGDERVGTIVAESPDCSDRIAFNVIQKGSPDYLEDTCRTILEELYESAGGDGWTHSDNWCTDLPLNQWYGVSTNKTGALTMLNLYDNNLTGTLPESIGRLANAFQNPSLYLHKNKLTGDIPASVFNFGYIQLSDNLFTGISEVQEPHLKPTQYILIGKNRITGSLPEFIGRFPRLNRLDLSDNMFTGTIPEAYHDFIDRVVTLDNINLNGNRLSGRLPQCIAENDNFRSHLWTSLISQEGDGFDLDGVTLNAPSGAYTDAYGNQVVLEDIYSSNELTLLYDFYDDWGDNLNVVNSWRRSFGDKGFAIIGMESATSTVIQKHAEDYDLDWYMFNSAYIPYQLPFAPSMCLIDSEGRVVLNPLEASKQTVRKALADRFGEPESEYDYMDGRVDVIQKASEGNGIDIILMGDAFKGDMIEDGTYLDIMTEVSDHFFSVEPFASFRHLFNVYSVTAVSDDADYLDGLSTAFECYYNGSVTGGNDTICKEYALKAISQERLRNALIIVVMNSTRYGGTCYMYPPEAGDYGEGTSIAYIPLCSDESELKGVIHHEAGGHGFAKLADEYYKSSNGKVPDSEIERIRSKQQYGWWSNCDFTSDPSAVRWAYILDDMRYKSEDLGVYKGALSYPEGVWRPSNTSIMRTNKGKFNAPSRHAIWYRIQKLAYGLDKECSYEDFVAYDMMNLTYSPYD